MSTDLREELDALARTQTFSPDPSAWDRGRRARRRSYVARGAAALAVVAVVAGAGALAVQPSAVGPANDAVPDGAIPSRIPGPTGQPVTDLAIGQASVAYVEPVTGAPVLVDASTGEAHRVELPDFAEVGTERMREQFTGPWLALSPDGTEVWYPVVTEMQLERRGPVLLVATWYRVVDLTTGETRLVDPSAADAAPTAASWSADGRAAVDLSDGTSWTFDPATGDSGTSPFTGVVAPGLGISAPYPTDDDAVRAMPFETATGTDPERPLPRDLYPDGAVVSPVGWADNSLLVAQVDAPGGSYVEGEHLVLMTSPDRPESEWTWRILVRDLPPAQSVSLAVDLVPDLDGTAAQQLTHDFGKASDSGPPSDLPSILAGVMAVLVGLVFIATMTRTVGHGDR